MLSICEHDTELISRSIFVAFNKEVEIDGITAWRFKLPPSDIIWDHPDFCFCPKGPNNVCYKKGVLSLAPCQDSKFTFRDQPMQSFFFSVKYLRYRSAQ